MRTSCPFCGCAPVKNGGTGPECGTSIPKSCRRSHRSEKANELKTSSDAVDRAYHGGSAPHDY